jgi:signal peptidase I
MLRINAIRSIKYAVLMLILFLGLNYIFYLNSFGVYVAVSEGNSMEPNLSSGDILVHQPVNNLEEGDIVSYEPSDNVERDVRYAVHRIVEVDKSRDRPYKIKGDNNEHADGWYKKDQIESKVSFKIFNGEFLLPIVDKIPKI